MNVFAVVPVKDLWCAKSRLKAALAPGARAGLVLYMMGRVLAAAREAGAECVCVVSPDRIVLDEAEKRGVLTLHQSGDGLNPALEQARALALERGADAMLVLPADLPLVEAGDVRAVIEAAEETEAPRAVVSPDAARAGTNALLLSPPDALSFSFGEDSFEAHLRAAREKGLEVRVVEESGLAFDLDTADDLARMGWGPEQVPKP